MAPQECPRGMPVSEKVLQVSVKESGLEGALIRIFGPWVWYPSLTGLWTHRAWQFPVNIREAAVSLPAGAAAGLA